ncbi:MAG: hypothetical protein ABJC09_16715 [Terriglobia bacterium]
MAHFSLSSQQKAKKPKARNATVEPEVDKENNPLLDHKELDDILNPNKYPETLPDFLTAERNPYTGQLGLMDRTDRPHYDKHCNGIIECLKPANALEKQLAWSIASDYWRLNRARTIEDGIFANSHPNPSGEFGPTPVEKQIAQSVTAAFIIKQSDFKFLSQYEMRIQRTLNRNKAELKQLQTERRRFEAAQPPPVLEIVPVPDPAGNGFVFSNPPAEPEMAAEARATAPASPAPAPVFKANQQSGLIPTNTEAQGNTSGQGFAYSNPLAGNGNRLLISQSLDRIQP